MKYEEGHPNSDLNRGGKQHRTKCVKSKGPFSQKIMQLEVINLFRIKGMQQIYFTYIKLGFEQLY